ncbi:uncharacterized protein LOC119110105 [Pollicipes pollicipes]|uniref:uncharacterized protein LOC119110105 n=1 Tax=Pollicipes pollicipes TaxID=41117 RepID=UPI0018852795|nr:uncharacterized protein LOC119110105 [Pollicipes pollicipes]
MGNQQAGSFGSLAFPVSYPAGQYGGLTESGMQHHDPSAWSRSAGYSPALLQQQSCAGFQAFPDGSGVHSLQTQAALQTQMASLLGSAGVPMSGSAGWNFHGKESATSQTSGAASSTPAAWNHSFTGADNYNMASSSDFLMPSHYGGQFPANGYNHQQLKQRGLGLF